MSAPILEVSGLKKYFPVLSGLFKRQTGVVKAVDGIDFTVHEKEVLGIVGESGCGKSTLGRAAIRLIEPTEGQVKFFGEDLLELNVPGLKEARKKLQMVFQDPYASLNPRKTIGASIGEPLLYHKLVTDKEACRNKVAESLQLVGLSADQMNRYPHQFSGGQQQRICIARALALNPKLIVCDESVSALDVSVQAQIINLLQELKESLGLSYLFISHDLSVIRHISDQVIVLYLGKVMEQGPVDEVFNNPKHPYTQALLSAVPIQHPKEKKKRILLKGELPSPEDPPSGCPFRTRCPYAKPECAKTPPEKTASQGHVYNCILDP